MRLISFRSTLIRQPLFQLVAGRGLELIQRPKIENRRDLLGGAKSSRSSSSRASGCPFDGVRWRDITSRRSSGFASSGVASPGAAPCGKGTPYSAVSVGAESDASEE